MDYLELLDEVNNVEYTTATRKFSNNIDIEAEKVYETTIDKL